MRRALIMPALLLVLAGGAAAETKAPYAADTVYDSCLQKDPSTAGMIACSAEAEEAWDKELNDAFRDLARALKGRSLEVMRQAQRDWVEYRNREFRLIEAIRGELDGTMWGPVMAGQRVALVKARALQLRAYKSFLDDGRP